MKTWKKATLFLMIIFSVLLFLPHARSEAAATTASGTWGELSWTLDDSELLTIEGSGKMNDFDDASTEGWLAFRDSITRVVIGPGITRIGDGAFYSCNKLTSVTIPAEVEGRAGMGMDAFYDCTALTDVYFGGTFGQWVNDGSSVWGGNDVLDSARLHFGDSVASGLWGDLGWSLCEGGQLIISGSGRMNNFTRNSQAAWRTYGDSVHSVYLINGVENIGNFAFYDFNNLTGLIFRCGCSSIGDSAFYSCGALGDITFPNNLTSIGKLAFSACQSMTELDIPVSLTSIGQDAFRSCGSFSYVLYRGTTAQWTEIDIGSGNDELTARAVSCQDGRAGTWGNHTWTLHNDKLTISGIGPMKDYDSAVMDWTNYPGWWYYGVRELVIQPGVTSIGDRLFAWYSERSQDVLMTKVTLPDGLVSIGVDAFYGNVSLNSVAFPSSVKMIGDHAFSKCGMQELIIGAGVESIGKGAFSGCFMTSVTIPANVKSIGDGAFSDCWNLSELLVDPANSTYCSVDGVLYSKDMTELISCPRGKTGSFSIPAGVKTIRANACSRLSGLTALTIPEGVTSVGSNAFYGCNKLKELRIPSSVKSIGESAFYGCSGITELTLLPGLESIGDNAFQVCSGLNKLTLPQGLTVIGSSAFIYCSNLASVTIPQSVTNIGEYAFFYCSNLADIYYDGTQEQWDAISVGDSNDPLLGAKLHFGADAFDARRDAYPFGNGMSAYGYTGRGPGESYPIPYEPSFRLIFGDTVAGKAKFAQAIRSPWSGNCCGMSSSAALMYAGQLLPADFGKSDVYSLSIADSNGSMTVLTFVEAMQVAQYTDQFAKDYSENRVYYHELAAGSTKLTALYNAVNSGLDGNHGTVIGVCRSGIGAHALLAYRMEKISDTESRMYVYDCNFPGETRYFTLRFDSAGQAVGWSYDMGGYGVWGGESSDFISYIPYSTIEYIWTHRGNLYDGKEMLSFAGENLSILDFSGREVASIVDGQLFTSSADIYELPELSMTWSGVGSVFLPRDFYTVTSNDGMALELSMVDQNTGASVVTSASMVSFAVDDSLRENTVIVENAAQNDSYTVSLESSREGVKYENVVVSGTGRGESISISGDNDTLSISNCNVDSLQINGVERVAYTITTYTGAGGSISPRGDILIDANGGKLFRITPDAGYEIDSVKVDGEEQGTVSEYEFTDVTRDHRITVTFRRVCGVTEAFFDRASNTVSAELVKQGSVRLVCAAFDSEGRMICMASRTVAKNSDTASVVLPGGALPENVTIRLLLLDSSWRPLCKSYSFTA